MAKYKLLEEAFINNRLYKAGEHVEVPDHVIPGPHMFPADGAAKKKAAEVGLVNGPLPDVVEELTPDKVDVTKYGASPQQGSGMELKPETSF